MNDWNTTLLVGTVLSLIALCVIIAWVGERIRNAIREGTREARARGVKRLALLRDAIALKRADIVAKLPVHDGNYVQKLNQLVLDATGEDQGMDQVIWMGNAPCPYLVGLGERFQECVFALDGKAMVKAGLVPRRVRWHAVDAVSGDLFAVETLEAIYRHLAARYGVTDLAMPHRMAWYVAIVPPKEGRR